ncbi:predicted protein [Naegleria gruberi]|uniref:Predicted protein n=1 Tax=Naegleria gruberi TaxID=5762 RepID=D2VYC4_NAEGR|nr:uncharacterized protein NAEGRDRAFT_74070 [Naegleria gruberi]EFC38181.1 predicted protein [Naegleria gruberi]|eukprot:XP_002670925.1 predicted protein [Naegleria gruberi strain NEG-M]
MSPYPTTGFGFHSIGKFLKQGDDKSLLPHFQQAENTSNIFILRRYRWFLVGVFVCFFMCFVRWNTNSEDEINNNTVIITSDHKIGNKIESMQTHSTLVVSEQGIRLEPEVKQVPMVKEDPKHTFTGILLHFKRRNGIKKILSMMIKYPFISQVIVWNNNPDVSITHQNLIEDYLSDGEKSKTLEKYKEMVFIHNHNENIKDKAKYLACELANTTACFYCDDDWDITRYANALLADFYNEPSVMHSVTEPYTYYTNLVWSFYDSNINLHTAFAWIGCGSMFLKSLAVNHLQKVDKFLESNPKLKNLVPLSDIFFSIWQNNAPSQIVANIAEISVEKENVAFSSQGGFLQLQHESSMMAIKILHDELTYNSFFTIFPKKEIENPFPLFLKSPSSKDSFLFYSDLFPFLLKNVSFDITNHVHAKRSTRDNLPQGADVDFFYNNNPTRAVDSDPSSCWQSNRNVGMDSFFGVDLYSVVTDIAIEIIYSHTKDFHATLKTRHSIDRKNWVDTSAASYESNNFSRHSFKDSVRYIEFFTQTGSRNKFGICDFKVFKNGTSI